MKLILILTMLTLLCFASPEKVTKQENQEASIIPKAKVLYDLGKNFKILVKDEVIVSQKTGPTSSQSQRTTMVSGYNYKGKVMNNGFIELTNRTGTMLIPMNNVLSILLKN